MAEIKKIKISQLDDVGQNLTGFYTIGSKENADGSYSSKKLDLSFLKKSADDVEAAAKKVSEAATNVDTATTEMTTKVNTATTTMQSQTTTAITDMQTKTSEAVKKAEEATNKANEAAESVGGQVAEIQNEVKAVDAKKLDKGATAVAAEKLSSDSVGGATTPVYFSGGKPVAMNPYITWRQFNNGAAPASTGISLGSDARAGILSGDSAKLYGQFKDANAPAFQIEGDENTYYRYGFVGNKSVNVIYDGQTYSFANPWPNYGAAFFVVDVRGDAEAIVDTSFPFNIIITPTLTNISETTLLQKLTEGLFLIINQDQVSVSTDAEMQPYLMQTTFVYQYLIKSSLASGYFSMASGRSSVANGHSSFASGYMSVASGASSVASGYRSVANNSFSMASGYMSVASGHSSFASGYMSVASGQSSFASGRSSVASGHYSFASGYMSVASGANSVASGHGTKATTNNQFVMGRYNTSSSSLFVIGNGSSDEARQNCFEVGADGSVYLYKSNKRYKLNLDAMLAAGLISEA